jgi:hypothetical protein
MRNQKMTNENVEKAKADATAKAKVDIDMEQARFMEERAEKAKAEGKKSAWKRLLQHFWRG